MLWIALALMTAAAMVAVLWPLARGVRSLRGGTDVAVYRDQLDEVERDRHAGLIGDNEAAAARIEVSRRLIAAAEALTPPAAPLRSRRRIVTAATVVLLPLLAGSFYFSLGSPSLPDQPLAPRLTSVHGGQSMDDLIAQVERHLTSHPDDGRGWEVIAPIYLRLGRFDDAVNARRNALRVNGSTAERLAALGEALVLAANGVVTAEAKREFEGALALDGKDVLARYFLGLAAEQDGDNARAAATWRALLADSPPSAPWVGFVNSALARVEPGLGSVVQKGPGEQQIAAASELSSDQRNTMIRGMVERLAERLRQDGSDVDGWQRLVRSYVVLGEPDKARAAVADARRALASDPGKLQRLDDFVKGLGIEG
jgi:cytochrome c-type biogenesis protein CcmH